MVIYRFIFLALLFQCLLACEPGFNRKFPLDVSKSQSLMRFDQDAKNYLIDSGFLLVNSEKSDVPASKLYKKFPVFVEQRNVMIIVGLKYNDPSPKVEVAEFVATEFSRPSEEVYLELKKLAKNHDVLSEP